MIEALIAYFVTLYALVLLISFKGDRGPMLRTILAIAVTNALSNVYTIATWDSDPFWWFMAMDLAAAVVVLMHPAGKAQAIVGWSFVGKLAMHTGYGLTLLYGYPDAMRYWWGLTVVGFLQLLFVGGWWIYARRPDLFELRGLRRHSPSPSSAGVAR